MSPPGDGSGFELYDLHSAAKQDDIPAVIRLLKEGALIDKRDPYGYTPLHWACQKGHTRIVQALLAAGANANVRDKWRRTPLHRAAKEGHKDVVAALVEGGAEINAQGDSNWTPLHCSSFHGQLEIVEMLLRYGADQSAKDMRGRTCAVVCDMGLYDVDQNIKNKIKRLLEAAPPLPQRKMVDTRASAENAAPLNLSPSATTPPSLPPQSATTADDRSLTTPEAAAEAAARAAGVAAGVCGSPPSAATAEAIAAANASAAIACMAAESGVFAMWDRVDGQGGSFGPGLLSSDNGGGDDADAEDALWREMWAALHVPDPDNPDNNLYSEVKTLRKDVKRLRSDLSNDAGNYEGIFGGDSVSTPGGNQVGESTVGTLSAAAAAATTQPTTTTTTTTTTADADGESSSLAVTVDTGSVRAAASEVIPPPAKRQRSDVEAETSIIIDNVKSNNTIANGVMVPEATITLSSNGVVGGVAAGNEKRIAAMSEAELREELRVKSQLTAELAREVNTLRRRIEAIVAAEGAAGVAWGESGFGTPSVLDEGSLVKKVG